MSGGEVEVSNGSNPLIQNYRCRTLTLDDTLKMTTDSLNFSKDERDVYGKF